MRRLVPCALLLFAACDGLTTGVKAPDGLVCARIKAVQPNKLTEALIEASGGDCVIAPEGTWVGSFIVPQDVSLAASGLTLDFRVRESWSARQFPEQRARDR